MAEMICPCCGQYVDVSEIRADAIDEFMEKCKVKIQNQSIEREDDCPFLDIDEIQEIAEELKEQK